MVKLTAQTIAHIISNPQNIRNISVIALADHGKTTLIDSLIARARINFQGVGESDYKPDEKETGVTLKSTGISLCYEYDDIENNNQKDQFLINLIDCPGHVDFSSEVTAALRSTDGAIVVVDCIEGLCVSTGTVLRQAMREKIHPVLMINKVDRSILELQEEGEAIYQRFLKAIDFVNVDVSVYKHPDMGDLTLHPSLGNVAFGTGKDCWGFTLTRFARIYSQKFGISEAMLREKFWGDNYFDPETRKWTTEPISASGKPLARGFVKFIIDPIIKLTKTIMKGSTEQIDKAIAQVNVQLTQEERELPSKLLLKAVFSKWMNCADCLLEMCILQLPSPKVAQRYRAAYLYEGPQDDQCAQAIKNCDPKGPLMIYVSKMIPSQYKERFYAFGRVFSGTVFPGQKVRILGPNYKPGSKDDVAVQNVQKAGVLIGRSFEALSEVPCGNTVCLAGVDQYLVKTGTISDCDDAHNIRTMKYSISPVVRVAVEPKNASDLPKLIHGLNKLAKSDPVVQIYTEDSGQHVVAGTGELHIEICLKDLEKHFAQCEIKKSDPVVTYKETITEKSSQVCLTKTANKHNRLYCSAEPLDNDLCDLIEKGELGPKSEPHERTTKLVNTFGWDKEDAERIWTFGPENTGANVLVDMTKGVHFMDEIEDSMKSAFQWATAEGVLAGERVRRMRLNIMDAVICNNRVIRGSGQILRAARRVYYACELTAQPCLQEPTFLTEITAPASVLGGIYQCLDQRRGQVFEEEVMSGTALTLVKAYLPVAESFGFSAHLRSLTRDNAFAQCVFSHWSNLNGDPLDKTSPAYEIVRAIRKYKGDKEEIPELSNYLDKL